MRKGGGGKGLGNEGGGKGAKAYRQSSVLLAQRLLLALGLIALLSPLLLAGELVRDRAFVLCVEKKQPLAFFLFWRLLLAARYRPRMTNGGGAGEE